LGSSELLVHEAQRPSDQPIAIIVRLPLIEPVSGNNKMRWVSYIWRGDGATQRMGMVGVAQYQQSGFRGPLNWYRNIDRNIEITPQLETAKIEQPSIFIAGKKDPVLSSGAAFGGGSWLSQMDDWVTDLRGKVFIKGAGHWVQMERPVEVNEALLGFLRTVS